MRITEAQLGLIFFQKKEDFQEKLEMFFRNLLFRYIIMSINFLNCILTTIITSVSTNRLFCKMGKNRPLWVELSNVGFYAEFYGAFSGVNFLNTIFHQKMVFFVEK